MTYITPKEYEEAERNGISARNVYQRVNQYNWSNKRAITEPLTYVTEHSDAWKEWGAIALQNGISSSTFRKRVYRGMKPKEAATLPLRKGKINGVLPNTSTL